MKKFRRSKRALSPVVASIILIAVTVAVSIAVAAWMGMLTVGFMGSSSITITNTQFVTGGQNITLTLKNTGTNTVTIVQVKVNNNVATADPTTLTMTAGQDGETLTITGTYASWVAGNPYKIDLFDSSGQIVGSTQQTAT